MVDSCTYRDSKQNCYLDQSLHTILVDWTIRNMQLPSSYAGVVIGLFFLLITWYVVNWMLRMFVSLIFPIVIIALALFIFPYVRKGDMEELVGDTFETLSTIVSSIVKSLTTVVQKFAS